MDVTTFQIIFATNENNLEGVFNRDLERVSQTKKSFHRHITTQHYKFVDDRTTNDKMSSCLEQSIVI